MKGCELSECKDLRVVTGVFLSHPSHGRQRPFMLLHIQHGTAWGSRCYWLEPALIAPVLNFQTCGWGPLLHVA